MPLTLDALKIDVDKVSKKIINGIKEYMANVGINRAVVGVSGGVDSATTLTLAVRALGPENITALIMPDPMATPEEDIEDARSLAKMLGVKVEYVEIGDIFNAYAKSMPFFNLNAVKANGNLKARIRMCLLYYYANVNNALVIGSSDKSEILIGYFTKYGDGGVDLLPIGDLYKTQVRQLAIGLGVPKKIAYKPSSPRLWPGHMAEDELGLSYEEIDIILYAYHDLGLSEDEIVQRCNVSADKVKRVISMVRNSEHKRKMPPIIRIK